MSEKPELTSPSHIIPPIESDRLRGEMAALVAALELSDIGLLACTARRGAAPDLAAGESELTTDIKHRAQFVETDRVILCGVRFRIGPATAAPEAQILRISAEYALVYRVVGTLIPGDDLLRVFAARNAVPHAWPFFRELVSSLTGKMGLPPATLPVLKCFPDAPKRAAVADEGAARLTASTEIDRSTKHGSSD